MSERITHAHVVTFGRSDSAEFANGIVADQSSPINPDTDGDSLLDGPEVAGTDNNGVVTGFGPTKPNLKDTDGDTFDDPLELRFGFSPNNASVIPGSEVTIVNGSDIGVFAHGDGAKDIALRVPDATEAYRQAVSRGATGLVEPHRVEDEFGSVELATISTYGDVVHTFVNRGDYEGAYAECLVIARVFPKDPSVALRVARNLVELERLEEACQWFERGLRGIDDADRSLHVVNRLSDIYLRRLDRQSDAIRVLQEYVTQFPNAEHAETVRGRIRRLNDREVAATGSVSPESRLIEE